MRQAISTKTRRQVLERDDRTCRKCKRAKDLALHHIHPVADGGTNDPENLITLCEDCHHEWEHLIFVKTDKVTFDEWLNIPPALVLVTWFAKSKYWPEQFSASEARKIMIQSYQWICPYMHEEDMDEEPEPPKKRARKRRVQEVAS